MQTLAVTIAATFVDDAVALVTGLGRMLRQAVTAPVDRIANACDFAGILAERRATFELWRSSRARGHRQRPRFSLLGRFSPFRNLSHLT